MILNFGSINIDNVYRVGQMPLPGQTIAAKGFDKVLGGKGINQTIAAQRAGGYVLHIGNVGDDTWILNQLAEMDVDTQFIRTGQASTGHAIIFVDDTGENEIVIHAGANNSFKIEQCADILEEFTLQQPWVLLQNEINLSVEIAAKAKEMGFKICYSAAPFEAEHARAMLPYVDLLVANESEFQQLSQATGKEISELDVAMVLVTLGARGAELHIDGRVIRQSSFAVEAVDTTGAGDTFLGSFIARLDREDTPEIALEYAAAASAIQVTRMGAAPAIPARKDVQALLKEKQI